MVITLNRTEKLEDLAYYLSTKEIILKKKKGAQKMAVIASHALNNMCKSSYFVSDKEIDINEKSLRYVEEEALKLASSVPNPFEGEIGCKLIVTIVASGDACYRIYAGAPLM